MVIIDNGTYECYEADKANNQEERCQCHKVTSYVF